MSALTISNLPRITASELYGLLSSPTSTQTVAVIDVRDSDYIGGHIASSVNIPTSTHDTALPELARKLADKKVVVFHCMLSQQRGPSAALKYARERQRLLHRGVVVDAVGGASKDGAKVSDHEMGRREVEGESENGLQRVVVLQGGFEGWVRSGHGSDNKVTEAFVKDLWEGELD